MSSWPHLLSGLLIFDPGAWRGYYFFLSFRCVMAIVLCACNFFLRVTVGGNCLLAEAVFSSQKLPPKLQTFHHISITSKH